MENRSKELPLLAISELLICKEPVIKKRATMSLGRKEPMKRFIACLTALLLIAACSTALAAKGNESKPVGNLGNPGVIPPQSKAHGMTYGEWSARQWQWVYSLPVDNHPLFDTADCSEGQDGHVWFLGGTWTLVETSNGEILGQVTRDCTIPSGTPLFFPIMNVECSTIEGNGATKQELASCANQIADLILQDTLFLKIDGMTVRNMRGFRAESPLFEFGPLPENNALGASAGATSPAVGDGFFAMLAPLGVGKHTLHWSATADLTSLYGFVFKQDITYNITVVPRGQYEKPAQ